MDSTLQLSQQEVETDFANLLIGQEVSKGSVIEVGVRQKENTKKEKGNTHDAVTPEEFTFEVKKKHKGESPIVMPKMVGQK
jgi:hypothetical protein